MMVNVHGNVEVWCEFSERWVEGFELNEAEPGHVRLFRRNDGLALPDLPSHRVRRTS